ncbi:hypothetical protein ACIHQR_21155 [Corallococcus coralloides]|uniref:hypothetical protein n=1 Tax=Corallococcus coralloides TaxID=184914 RepID=UPI00384E7C58
MATYLTHVDQPTPLHKPNQATSPTALQMNKPALSEKSKLAIETITKFTTQEELKISHSPIALQEPQIALSAIVRVSDLTYLYPEQASAGSNDPDTLLTHLTFGHNKALRLLLPPTIGNKGAPLFQMNDLLFSWAHQVLIRCGQIAMAENWRDLLGDGTLKAVEVTDDSIILEPAPGSVGIEALESKDHRWLKQHQSNRYGAEWETLHAAEVEIRHQMGQVAFRWNDYFLGYNSTEEINDHFTKKGALLLATKSGHDAFRPDSSFGGHSFRRYLAVIEILVGHMLSHVAFGQELFRHNPDLQPIDLMTMFFRIDDMAEELSNLLDIEQAILEQILRTLTMAPSNNSRHTFVPGGPTPPFIEIANGMVLRSVRGMLDEPFFFMLKALRRSFERDWDKAVYHREKIFRDDIYSLFPQESIIKMQSNVRLRVQGQVVTDIDAITLDLYTGEIGLFQLKWQDPFATSMTERSSRKANFLAEAQKWIDAVSKWVLERGLEQLGKDLGLPAAKARNISSAHLFVIGRNFAHFSSVEAPDERAAWGHWPQLVRLTTEHPGEKQSPIKWLHDTLKSDSPHNKPINFPSDHHEEIGGLSMQLRLNQN